MKPQTDSPPILVFSDLDGTLLDHESYSWAAAKPALDRLADMGAAVVLASSKTGAEISVLQREMGLSHWPAIVENGTGLLGETAEPTYHELRARLDSVALELRQSFVGFGDLSIDEIADATGLSPDAATLAAQRMFSEPGTWTGSDVELDAFLDQLALKGISARRGGRFLTLSFGGTKADRMGELIADLRPLQTVALGDAPNDVEMLEAADYGVVIANFHSKPLPKLKNEASGRIIRTKEAGPLGWNRAMMQLLDRLEHEAQEQG